MERAKHPLAVLSFFSVLFIAYFSPVIFTARLLPSDGQIASFHSPLELWTNFVWGGFPAAADPQWESWYPLSRFCSLLPHGFNVFMVSAYVLAASFTYGYVFTLTGSRLAGLIGGIAFGMSGFMMAHLGHTAIIHAALWLPLVIWSLEKLRSGPSAPWFAATVVSVACSVLGGHLQVSVYVIVLASAYAVCLGLTATPGRLRYLITVVAVLTLGWALAAVQLLPTMELAGLSVRAKMVFEDFVSQSVPRFQIVQLLFPYVFGGAPLSPYGVPYFGEWGLQELAGYPGLVTLMLAVIAARCLRRERVVIFWSIAAVVALLLTLGNATPLAKLTYHIPPINRFRVPARHFLEMSFALSVLAGVGVHAIQAGRASAKARVGIVVAAALVMVTSGVLIHVFDGNLATYAAAKGVALIPAATNPAVIVPLLVCLLSAIGLLYWSRRSQSWSRGALLLGVVVFDMGSFGWFYEWRYHAPSATVLGQSVFPGGFRRNLDDGHQRLLQLERAGGAPDMFRLYKLPSLNGYGPLMIRRFSELSGVTESGSVHPIAFQPGNRAIDLLAARYLLRIPLVTLRAHDVEWSKDDLRVNLGEGCGQRGPTQAELRLVVPVRATRAAIVSTMGCSTTVPDDEAVLKLSFIGAAGAVDEAVLRAGRDTSEWAVDCDGVKSRMRHRRAGVFASWSAGGRPGDCQAHNYLATVPLPGGTYSRIKLEWSGAPGVVNVTKMTLIDQRAGTSHAVSPSGDSLDDRRRFRPVEQIGEITVYENADALPRAWLASEVVSARPDDILTTIRTSVLPDGRPFDPRHVALVEEPLSVKVEDPDPAAVAEVVRLTNTGLEIRTRAREARFLVMSDIYYPGWRTSIDGTGVQMFRTNYALRGVMVPAGSHTVRVEFRPFSVYLGGVVSGLAAVITLVVSGVLLRGRWGSSGH